MKYPDIAVEPSDENAADYIKVDVKSDLCRRYTAHVIKDVKIEQSPWWLQKRLIAAGMRPINNIVDITNFVMIEYGQPLHAFDIRRLAGQHIIVDTAENGTKFTTLDGTERTLDDTMLMINDENGPVCVAGVMGGLDSEIVDDTQTVVLESASFVGSSVRFTSKKLNLRTEASGRYEKGIDPNQCEDAAERFCRLVQILGCGKVLNGFIDVYKKPEKAPTVTARVSRINKVLGIEIGCAAQAIWLRQEIGENDIDYLSPATRAAYDHVRKVSDPVENDVVMHDELVKFEQMVEDGSLLAAVEEVVKLR
jgi:phenylalanyl-tRNA synthetase beta chain